MTARRIAFHITLLTAAAICLFAIRQTIFARVAGAGVSESEFTLVARARPVKPMAAAISSNAKISHVVLKFTDDYGVNYRSGHLVSAKGHSLVAAEQILASKLSGDFDRLFRSFAEAQLDRQRTALQLRSRHELADLNSYFRIEVSSSDEASRLVNELNDLDYVEIAYVMPMPEPAGDIAPPTPDYQANQDYREAAPAGVDADYANTLPGGDGTGVKIIDIEGAWQTTHEDLDKAVGGLVAGTPINDQSWRNHGTAVIGVMIAGDNGYGVTGICPGADIGMVSIGSLSTAEAILAAINDLSEGDMILIELHAPGPHFNFDSRPDQLGYVCMEFWQANYDAIQYAWAMGIVVCEAAGNGAENFDDFGIYGSLFDTTYRNSHAIIIGAGYPWSSGINLQKHGFSNYGARVNLQGYGSGVYTTGYGTLFNGGGDENQYYTATFNGTSSASPIVTGASTCLQGYYKANYGAVMTSDMIRDALVNTGTAQLGDTSLHIGPRPNLQSAIASLSSPPSLYTNPILVESALEEGQSAVFDLWLINRSISDALDFSIFGNDSLARFVTEDWLQAVPSIGLVAVGDSVLIQVTLDATALVSRNETYTGILEISWGVGLLDSMTLVPAFLDVVCFDSTYLASSSDDPGGPLFTWIPAKEAGFKIPNSAYYGTGSNPLDDGTAGPITIGFYFPFYDSSYNKVYIGVNGAVSFTDSSVNSSGFFSNFDIPGVPFQTFISPFWNDLIIDTDVVPEAGIYIYKSLDTIVIEWYRLANFNQFGDTLTDFQLVLTRDRNITFQYKNVGTSGLEQLALLGLADIGCRNLSYYDAGDIPQHEVSASEAVRFTNMSGQWVQSGDVDSSGSLDVADVTYTVAYFFGGGPAPVPFEAGDIDCTTQVDIADLTALVAYLFTGGNAPCSYWVSF